MTLKGMTPNEFSTMNKMLHESGCELTAGD
ncbi:MAG: hypothetical protein EA417_01580 [Gammaproteobacteria bacterium]|nr:MAG: hypothetical protein EA417_01580 [Gammaproteobacteria bacterium]